MSDPMKKVQAGQPLAIPAEAYNAFIDAARDFQQRTRHVGQQATPGYRSAGIVLVKNESGADRLRFEVLGLGDPIILPDADEQQFKNVVAFRGEMPDETLHKGRFVILAEPLADGAIGRAYLAGVTAVRLRLEDSAQKVEAAEIIDADATALQPAPAGSAAVLWHQEQTGDVWAVVRLGNAAPAGVWVQITSTEASAGEYSSWQEVELTDDGEGGLTWTAKADGLAGPGDGVIYEVNGVENIPAGTVVQVFPNPAYDSEATDPLPAWLFQYEQPEIIGYGVPVDGEVDVPHDSDIDLTVTDAAGHPILDAQGQEQTIKVWRNALKRALYTDFQPGSVFVYVKFSQPAPSGHGGCIFSRTEAFKSYREWLPPDGYSLYPGEQPPQSADATGNPGNDKHIHVVGKMFMEDTAPGKGWAPWFVIDPAKLVSKHDLLNGEAHPDTAEAAPVAGDLILARADEEETVIWDRLPVGAQQSILRVDAAGLPAWLAKGWEQSILYVNAGVLDWFNAGLAQSLLITGAGGNLAWKPRGFNESIFITRGNQLDWLAKGDDGSLLAVDNGSLAWLPKGNDQSLLYMNVNKPDWFLPGLAQSMLIVGQQGLAWKPRGLDESIYITRNQQLDWLAKGDDPSILVTDGGTVQWSHGADTTGRGAVLWIDPNGVFGWGQSYHALLDDKWHYDTADALPTKGAMIYMTADPPNGLWDVLNIGADQSILHVNEGIPAWKAKGNDGAILIVKDGKIDWLPPAPDAGRPLLCQAGGPEWFDGPTETITFVTDVRVDGLNFQKKTREIEITKGVVCRVGDESEWQTFHTGTECPE